MRKLFALVGIVLIVVASYTLQVGSSQIYRSRNGPLFIISENSDQDLLDFPVEVTFGQNKTPQYDKDGMLVTDIRIVDEEVEIPSQMSRAKSTQTKTIFEANFAASTSNSDPVHNIDTGLNYTSIQEAIDAPETSDGHRIFVEKGIYYEHVVVGKSLSLIGENESVTIIDGSSTGTVVEIEASTVNITGFTIQNSGSEWPCSVVRLFSSHNSNVTENTVVSGFITQNHDWHNIGIHVDHCFNCIVSHNEVINNKYGIYNQHSSHCSVVYNTLTNNDLAVTLSKSDSCTLIENTLTSNGVGISLGTSSDNFLRRNNMTGNKYNFGVYGSILQDFVQDIDASNLVNGKPVVYLLNETDVEVPLDTGYVAAVNCSNITVQNVNLRNNLQGVLFVYTTNSTIKNNNITNNSYGISLDYSLGNTISENDITNNIESVLMENSLDCEITLNKIANNVRGYYGVELINSRDSNITTNIIMNNSIFGMLVQESYDCVVVKNTVVECGWPGIWIVRSDRCIIAENNASNNGDGIKLVDSSHCNVTGNHVSTNSKDELSSGLRIQGSNNVTVAGNVAMYNRYCGIFLIGSANVSLRNNNMTSNKYNFGVSGDAISHFMNDIDPSNTVDGKHIYYLINQRDLNIDSSTFPELGYLALVNSTNITVEDLRLTGNRDSVIFAFTTNSTIVNVNASETSYGLQLIGCINCSVLRNYANDNFIGGISVTLSNDCSVIGNRIFNSGYRGIRLIYSNSCRVTENIIGQSSLEGVRLSNSNNCLFYNNYFIHNNGLVYLYKSHNNSFYHNNFINNLHDYYFHESYNNIWDFEDEGNYWSDYEGVDVNNDGIGDTPYVIDENNQDNFPLMHARIEALEELTRAIKSWSLQTGIEKSLISKLQSVQRSLDKENYKAAIGQLTAFTHHVGALQEKKLTNEQANYAMTQVSETQRIINLIRE